MTFTTIYDDFIQIDALINRDNSGGQLVSALNKVVIINKVIHSLNDGNVGISFVIPAS